MMKSIVVAFCFLAFVVGEIRAFDADNYTAYIDELSEDAKFLEEYAKWSFNLFSQPDYLYGKLQDTFPCQITKSPNAPTSVHKLRPADIQCVGAIGDSLTAGLGAHAVTPVGLLFEQRGVSWSVGGDNTYSKVLTVPNILRQYNPDLKGFSKKVSVMVLNGQNAKNNGLNVAKSGDRSTDMPNQAQLLMDRIRNQQLCDWNNDWKLITFFVGGNDLCSFCEDPLKNEHTPEKYLKNVRDTLDALYNAPIPRTLVNLVLVLDVSGVQALNSGGFVCETLHKRTCPCAAFPTPEQGDTLKRYIPQYQQLLLDLAASDRYDGRSDFTVVVQPFMAHTKLPLKENNEIDFSYFAPDCFHFSGKGHAQAALSLWNNMLEPVGAKQWFWHLNEELKCPTEEYPYFFTKNNSVQAVAAFQQVAETQKTKRATSVITSSAKPDASSTKHHKDHKHHKSDSDPQYSKMQIAAFASFCLLVLILLIVAITKREKVRVYIHGAGRRHLNGFKSPSYPDGNDDDEIIWERSNKKAGFSLNNDVPKTHGTRMSFE